MPARCPAIRVPGGDEPDRQKKADRRKRNQSVGVTGGPVKTPTIFPDRFSPKNRPLFGEADCRTVATLPTRAEGVASVVNVPRTASVHRLLHRLADARIAKNFDQLEKLITVDSAVHLQDQLRTVLTQ